MIQLNLLPDVKLEYIKSKRTKHLVMLSSFIVIAFSAALFVIMFSIVNVVQKEHLKNLDSDIDTGVNKLQNTPEIDKVLTIQNQLNSLNPKHEEKPATTRVLTYVSQLLPAGSNLTSVSVDFAAGTMTVTGETGSINDTNKFVDTLKFANYKAQDIDQSRIKPDGTLDLTADELAALPSTEGKAFSEVVLGSFTTEPSDGKFPFSVSMKFDPIIFQNNKVLSINVPGIISTRSSTEKPNLNFTTVPQAQTEEGQDGE